MGTQLAGIFLAGMGVVAALKAAQRTAGWFADRATDVGGDRRDYTIVLVGIASLLICRLLPAVVQVGRFDARNFTVHDQHFDEDTQASQIAPLIAYVKDNGGRTYAGLPNNWGSSFRVGMVPVFKYLEIRMSTRPATHCALPR